MEDLRRDLEFLKMSKIKPIYTILAKKYGISRDTVRKYDNGYEGKPTCKPKRSKLDKYKEDIKSKLEIEGVFISSIYQYFYKKDNTIGTEWNFRAYIKKHKLMPQKKKKTYSRFETLPGVQMQFDWKEDLEIVSKHGEIFRFNIFVSILSHSRNHMFVYSKSRTRQEVFNCIMETFKRLGGVPIFVD